MGDRANIVVKDRDGQVWFYGHWAGGHYVQAVRDTLARKMRWDDGPYLARMIFCQFVPKEEWNGEDGYGISCSMGDNEYPILVVDVGLQSVYFVQERDLVDRRIPEPDDYTPDKTWTFSEFAQSADDEPVPESA